MTTIPDVPPTASRFRDRLPVFLRRGRIAPFLTIVMSGQLVYASFEAFKGSLMLPLQELLGITGEQFGLLMGYIGISVFFYIPAGWVLNRFPVRSIIVWSLAWRLVTYLVLFTLNPSFTVMAIIAVSWGILDAIMWPAIVNGVALMAASSETSGRGLAMGLLESIRRFAEFGMNLLIIGALALWADNADLVLRVACIAYALLLAPLIVAVLRVVPRTATAKLGDRSDSAAALVGLLQVLTKPRVWLAGIAALALYWAYINLIYCSAPYLEQVFHLPRSASAVFGIVNTGLVGIVAGVISGFIADYLFKSSTKMLATALALIAIVAGVVLLLPSDPDLMWVTMGLLVVVAFATFLGKAVILAPVAELRLPEGISGSAMSTGSFLAYASVFWAYPMNGRIVDAHADDPAVGYDIIFATTIGVAIVGCLCAGVLVVWNARIDRRQGEAAAV
jgi:predicted MFS family arabinose efflux permease